jgi:hypothetical protein
VKPRDASPEEDPLLPLARSTASGIALLLRQEYRQRGQEWWLYTLGRPARPLTSEEIAEHLDRGAIFIDRSEPAAGYRALARAERHK